MKSIDFNNANCDDLEKIDNKLLVLTETEKNLLEVYKDSDTILEPKVYTQLYKTITDTFDNHRKILGVRRDDLVDQALTVENLNCKIKLIKGTKQEVIRNQFEIRLAKFQNRLYKRTCAIEYRENKKKLNDEWKAAHGLDKAVKSQGFFARLFRKTPAKAVENEPP